MSCPATYTFDIPAFRVSFPAFANTTTYPDATLQMQWDSATCYIANANCGWLAGECRYYAITLMTAQLAYLAQLIVINPGQVPGIVQTATIDKISVGLDPAPKPNQWQWWLNQTPYGQQLLALLQVRAAGGLYVGGLPETAAFRRVGGIFI